MEDRMAMSGTTSRVKLSGGGEELAAILFSERDTEFGCV